MFNTEPTPGSPVTQSGNPSRNHPYSEFEKAIAGEPPPGKEF
jgi:hypothetical protein